MHRTDINNHSIAAAAAAAADDEDEDGQSRLRDGSWERTTSSS